MRRVVEAKVHIKSFIEGNTRLDLLCTSTSRKTCTVEIEEETGFTNCAVGSPIGGPRGGPFTASTSSRISQDQRGPALRSLASPVLESSSLVQVEQKC